MTRLISFVAVLALMGGIPVAAVMMPAENAAGSIFPKIINGQVRDLSGQPVSGVNVTVRMYNGATLTGTQYYTPLTDLSGFYTVTFAPAEWDAGYTISITVTKNLVTGTNSTTANEDPDQSLNATLGADIPEFSGLAAVVCGLTILAVLVVISSRRRSRPL